MVKKLISKGHRGFAKRLSCLLRGHQWEFQRKGSVNNQYLPSSRFMCDRCGRCEGWEEDDRWMSIMEDGIPGRPMWVYGYIPDVGQFQLWCNGSHFFHPTTKQMETRITHWRLAYPNP